jgi:hypothetical protein
MERDPVILRVIAVIGVLLLSMGLITDTEAGDAPQKVVVLDFELIDNSLEGASLGVDPAETSRLKLISDLLRDLLVKSGKYELIDSAPAATKIADAGFIHSCNGCDVTIAKELGADRVFTGIIDKVSTLILTVSITERDVASGKTLQIATAQIRGNTDESWSRGVRWLVKNRVLLEKQ